MAYKTTVATEPFAQQYYGNTLLDRALPMLVHEQFADKAPLPKKNSKQTTFRLFESWDAATVALTEGTTPDPSDYTVTQISATVDQYGRTAGITDMVDFTKPDPHLTELTEMLGENMGNTKDIIVRNAVVPNITNAYNATAAGTIAAGVAGLAAVAIDATIIDLMDRVMLNLDAPRWTRMIKPGPGTNSWPVGACYWAITHPTISYTVKRINGFVPVEQYAKQNEMGIGEYGAYKNIRFVETTNGYYDADEDEYSIPFIAPHAYASVPLSEMDGKLYFKDFGSGDDILEQRATVGWKGCWTATTLNDDFAALLRVIAE